MAQTPGMKWGAMERLISDLRTKRAAYVEQGKEVKKRVGTRLNEAYKGTAATTTDSTLDTVIQNNVKFLDATIEKLENELTTQKRRWQEQQERAKKMAQVEFKETHNN